MFSGFKKKGSSILGQPSGAGSTSLAPSPSGSRKVGARPSSLRSPEDQISTGLRAVHFDYPEEIEEDLKLVRRLVTKVNANRCYACNEQLSEGPSTASWFDSLTRAQRSGHDFSVCAVKCPNRQCGLDNCAGCGKEPAQSSSVASATGGKLVYCCKKGLSYAVWALLCKFDEIELSMQPKDSSHSNAGRGKVSTSQGGGTGYGSSVGGSALLNRAQPRYLSFAKADDRHDSVKQMIFLMLRDLLASQSGQALGAGLAESIELSFLQDRAAQILRNDSMGEMSKRKEILVATVALLEVLVASEETRYLVTDARFAKNRSPGLAELSQEASSARGKQESGFEVERCKDAMSSSLLLSMKNLTIQCEALLSASRTFAGNFDDAAGRELIGIARRVLQVYKQIKANEGRQERSEATSQEELWRAFNAGNRVKFVDGVLQSLEPRMAALAEGLRYSPPGRIKRITLELADMTTSLPDGVFLCAQWERPDVMKCMIIGPEGTPYEGGLFEFDIVCPSNYPSAPPKVLFSLARGLHRFNPNLHADGKVCLSLLGTWPGPPETQWQAGGQSTLLQVLISVQAMILGVRQPILNEPGWERADRRHDRDFARHAAAFNGAVRALTSRVATLDWLARDSHWHGFWHRLLVAYFRSHAATLLATLDAWAQKQPDLRILPPPPVLRAALGLGPLEMGNGNGNDMGMGMGLDFGGVLSAAITRRLEEEDGGRKRAA